MTTDCQLHRPARRRSTHNWRHVQHKLYFDGFEGKFNATIHRAINQTRIEQSRHITVNSLHVTPDTASRLAN
ncbi:MAG: hypothetical protein IPO15_23405 [Anaerolineae bacterium]|nr:hypothetical protein [Anaerolineae bacterium]